MQSGQLLCNRYLIEKHLARGGFGQTYLATDTHLPSKPQVVVKLLKPINNDPATLQIAQRLFNREAQTLEQLGRDNDRIPSLYAYFELGNEFYVVQEFIAGTTLQEELQDRKLSESETLAILKEILIGLTKVHSQNTIHRDLKPNNIIRRARDWKLVLIDFGAVKQVRAATVTTQNPASSTIGIGTKGYMPSEQGLGYPKLASDIYAVGAIGIQCLTGFTPDLLFNEDSLSIEWQHLRQVDRDFVRVLNQMIEPDYRQRYVNATDALNAIELLISSLIPPPVQPQIKQVNNSLTKPARSPVNQQGVGKLFVIEWVCACTAGWTTAGTIMFLLKNLLMSSPFLSLLSVLIIGVAQWYVLKDKLRKSGWWILATASSIIVAFFTSNLFSGLIIGLSSPSVGVIFSCMMIGLFTGIAQQFILQRQVPRSGRWLSISILAWGIAGTVDILIRSLPFIPGSGLGLVLINGLIFGVITGLITGVQLALLLSSTCNDRSVYRIP